MSTLLVADLPLSEQVALELAWAEKLEARASALLAALDPPAPSPAGAPLSQPPLAGGSNPLSRMEQNA